MTSDIVVHIAHKLATVKNVSVNVSDTSPRTSSTMENEDANVAENRNATTRALYPSVSAEHFPQELFLFFVVTSFVTSFFTSSSKEREKEMASSRARFIHQRLCRRKRERERDGVITSAFYTSTTFTPSKEREKEERLMRERDDDDDANKKRNFDHNKKTAHRIRPAVEAEKRARRDDAFEKHAQHVFVCFCV